MLLFSALVLLGACRDRRSASVELFHRDLPLGGDTQSSPVMTIDETKRELGFSIVRVQHVSGASVPSIMAIADAACDIARARNARYFVSLKQWQDGSGDWYFKIGFAATNNVASRASWGQDTAVDKLYVFSVDEFTKARGIGQQPGQQPETKVTETNFAGEFKRVKETFASGKVISRTTESGVQGSGMVDLAATKLFEDGRMTFCSISDNKKHTIIRSYYINEKLAAQEGDEDGDGFFETLILFDSDARPTVAFHRRADGSVTAFSSQELNKVKAGFALLEGQLPPPVDRVTH